MIQLSTAKKESTTPTNEKAKRKRQFLCSTVARYKQGEEDICFLPNETPFSNGGITRKEKEQ